VKWKRNDHVGSVGEAVRALRACTSPPPSSRHVYTLVASNHLSVPSVVASLVAELTTWRDDNRARLADQAPRASARAHPAAAVFDVTCPAPAWDVFTVPPPLPKANELPAGANLKQAERRRR
jgi:hypothetical protein